MIENVAMPYFPAEVEIAEREAAERKARDSIEVERYLGLTNGRRGCAHPVHRFASPRKPPSRLILPECAGRGPWLAARRDGVGGSEVGALIGVNEHETPMSIWMKKRRTEPDVELTGAPIEWGHRLEDVVAMKTAEEIGLVSRFGGGLWAMHDRPFIRVTPDRFACKPRSWKAEAVIECKTAGSDEHWESGTIHPGGRGTGSAPLPYQAQIQWQMGILGLEIGYLGCFVLGTERSFFTVEVHFDAEWFGEMCDAAERFWVQNILGEEMPLHDHRHPITEDLLKQLHPTVIQPSTDLPDLAEEWLKDYQRAKVAAEVADAELTGIKNLFREWTGDAGAAYLGDDKIVSYPQVNPKKGTIDVEALRRDYPDVAEAVTVRKSYRRMTISVPKKYKIKDDPDA